MCKIGLSGFRLLNKWCWNCGVILIKYYIYKIYEYVQGPNWNVIYWLSKSNKNVSTLQRYIPFLIFPDLIKCVLKSTTVYYNICSCIKRAKLSSIVMTSRTSLTIYTTLYTSKSSNKHQLTRKQNRERQNDG